MQIPCSEQELLLMQKIGSVADDLGMQAFIIGGFVRDKLLGRQTKDMDIVCVGDGIILANEVATRLGHSNAVNVFKNFGTAQFLHHDLELEFVGARKEY
jgi:poly(A) polymerase